MKTILIILGIIFILEACVTSSLDMAKEFAHSNCMRVGEMIKDTPEQSADICQKLETSLLRAKRLRNKDKDITRTVDSLITYLHDHPDSQEAKSLLDELKKR